MAQIYKIYYNICSGKCDNNIKYKDLLKVLDALGFKLSRIRGDHFIYSKDGIDEIINIQPTKDSMAKDYQIKQIRSLIKKYKMEVKKDV